MQKQFEKVLPVYTDSKKEIKIQEQLENIDLYQLPLISKFKFFQFSGRADNSFLTGNFNPADLQGKIIVIKSIKIVPYYEAASQDFFVTDGVTVNQELIPANCRINRIFDVYDYGCQFSLLLNGSRVPIFPTEVVIAPPAGDGNIPLDLDLDNIFFKYPEKLANPFIQMQLDAQIFQTLNAPAADQPLVKVFMQCYLI
jgi:hypothetical protein